MKHTLLIVILAISSLSVAALVYGAHLSNSPAPTTDWSAFTWTVVGKQYEPERTWDAPDGHYHDDADYLLVLRTCKDGYCRDVVDAAMPSTWVAYNIGDEYPPEYVTPRLVDAAVFVHE